MCKLLPLATLILLRVFTARGQAIQPEPGPVPPGWRTLFNGKNLDGWAMADAHGTAAYAVEDGAIRTRPCSGLLWYTREKIGNATLRVVYRMANSLGSSGIFIRVPKEPSKDANAIPSGIEVRIDDRGDDWHVTGVLNSITKALARAVKAEGEWNTMDISLDGPRTTVRLNGAMVTAYDDALGRSAPGYIALGCPDGRASIWFREISVR